MTGRNDPCPCGSGKRYKHCHGSAETPDELRMTLRESIHANEPALIEVPVDVMPNPWRLLGLR